MGTIRRLEPGAWFLICSSLFGSIPSGFLIVTLPIYLDRVGLHPELIGTLFTISGVVSSVLLVIFGLLADRYGRKPFVLIGSALPIVSYVILASTTSRPALILASAIGGVGLAGGMSGALMNAGFNALLSENSTSENRTTIFSMAEMAWVIAGTIGSLMAALPQILQSHFGQSYRGSYHIVFLLLVGAGAMGTLFLLPIHEQRSIHQRHNAWLPQHSGSRIGLLALSLGALGLGLGLIVQLLPLWFHLQFRVSEAFVGPWYGAAQIIALGGLAVAAPISRRIGAVPFTILAQGSASVILVLMPFSPTATMAAVLYVGRQVVMNASWPVQQAFIMDVVHPSERATASSLTYAAWSVASAFTPPIGGALLARGLYQLPFLLGAGCYVVAISTFYWFFKGVNGVRRAA